MGSERIAHLRMLAEQLFAAGFDVNFSHVSVDIAAERADELVRRIRTYDKSVTATSTVDGAMVHIRLSLGTPRQP